MALLGRCVNADAFIYAFIDSIFYDLTKKSGWFSNPKEREDSLSLQPAISRKLRYRSTARFFKGLYVNIEVRGKKGREGQHKK